jgi:hypothetical protein
MRGESYLPGAIVVAASLAATRTAHDSVCMITPEVGERARDALAVVFDAVVEVPYITARVRGLRTSKQSSRYGDWAHLANTKWRAFGLTCYEKVCFLDADKVILANMDALLDMPAPAATFGTPWADPAPRRRAPPPTPSGNASSSVEAGDDAPMPAQWSEAVAAGWEPFRPPREAGILDPYKGLRHGEPVAPKLIKFGLFDSSSVAAIASSIVLAPTAADAADFDAFLAAHEPLGSDCCNSGIDEQCLIMFYASRGRQWRMVSQAHNCIPWHATWVDEVLTSTSCALSLTFASVF